MVWCKDGPTVEDLYKAAIIKVRACLPFNHTMSEKQKSTSAVVLFSFLTRSLKLKDIPVIQGEPLMHIHKGHYLEEECQNLPEGACFVFSRINVYMCVSVMTLFEVKCTQNKICVCIRICKNPFLSCTNEFCIHWMLLSTIPPWFIILPVVFTRTMADCMWHLSQNSWCLDPQKKIGLGIIKQCPQRLSILVCLWKSYGIGLFCSFIRSSLVSVTTSPNLQRDPSFSRFALRRFSRSTESFRFSLSINLHLKTVLTRLQNDSLAEDIILWNMNQYELKITVFIYQCMFLMLLWMIYRCILCYNLLFLWNELAKCKKLLAPLGNMVCGSKWFVVHRLSTLYNK